jgi:glutamyl-tRNA reductase
VSQLRPPDTEPTAHSAPSGALAALRVLSISHRTAPLETLERMALLPEAIAACYRRARSRGIEAVVVSTCNRTELYWMAGDEAPDAGVAHVLPAIEAGQAAGIEKRGRAAAEHLFRVAAGLESLVLGESEILGQVRDALDLAEQHDAPGYLLSALFRAALRGGGRARQETAIGNGALSVASASVQLLARVRPDLTTSTVLVVGAGATGRKVARHLRGERVGRLVLLNRTFERAAEHARALGAEAAPLEALGEWLAKADAVVVAAQTEAPLITETALAAARRGRIPHPLALVDLSMPRAIEPACANLAGVTHHDLSSLEAIVARHRAEREREIPLVEALLDRELRVFEEQARESAARPVLAELRRMAEAIRRSELERALSAGGLDAAALDRVTRRIVDRLLHGPSMALRRDGADAGSERAREVRRIFGLEEADGADGRADDGPGPGDDEARA